MYVCRYWDSAGRDNTFHSSARHTRHIKDSGVAVLDTASKLLSWPEHVRLLLELYVPQRLSAIYSSLSVSVSAKLHRKPNLL